MKSSRLTFWACKFLTVALFVSNSAGQSLVSEIKYARTKMKLDNALLNGSWSVRFKLFDSSTGGAQIGPAITKSNVSISDGRMPAVSLDFGSDAFNGEDRWIEVRATQGDDPFRLVGGRQRFRAVPYALALPGMYTIVTSDDKVSVIGGSPANQVGPGHTVTISGGGNEFYPNKAIGTYSSVGGGVGNHSIGSTSTVAGGIFNEASQTYSTIGGGSNNLSAGFASTVGGGYYNTAASLRAVVAGGEENAANMSNATVGGGFNNRAEADSATISGGVSNTASGDASTVGGGWTNATSGTGATVPGGVDNSANGAYSLAAGRRAKAEHDGAFVWGDSTDADVSSSADNTFTARAANGFVFYTNSTLTSGAAMGAGSGSWTSLSDRNRKCEIRPINPCEILAKVAELPITSWRYDSQDPSIRHIGPMAQDFNKAFGVGEFENGITTIDIDGVALAAIQGLHEMLKQRDTALTDLRAENAELRAQLTRIESMLLTTHGSAGG